MASQDICLVETQDMCCGESQDMGSSLWGHSGSRQRTCLLACLLPGLAGNCWIACPAWLVCWRLAEKLLVFGWVACWLALKFKLLRTMPLTPRLRNLDFGANMAVLGSGRGLK